jgi:uncharacterized protein (DUF362 family)
MKDEKAWPISTREADCFLQGLPSFCESVTLHSQETSDQLVEDHLSKFIAKNVRDGFVLVRTSTSGNRPADHEIRPDLLRLVLNTAVRAVGYGRVALGDGPAYGSYADECRRLGWEDVAKDFRVQIRDLNEDEGEPLLPHFPVARSFNRADLVVNLVKAKTHRRFGVSLSGKSLLGVLPGKLYGFPKLAGRHRYVPWLALALEEHGPPIFSVIDGSNGIEGNGPLRGTATNSHFLTLGSGCIGPDVRAAIEMGFDPLLIPLFLFPTATCSVVDPKPWYVYRHTNCDYLPPLSCYWLYRSLHNSKRREQIFRMLQSGAMACWPSET